MNSYVKIILWGVGGVLLTSLISMIITALICFILGGGEWFADIITALGLISSFISVTVAVLLRIKDEQNPDKPRNHISAGILALLLGGLGAHKYYCRKYVWGIIYVLFCWITLPSSIAFIEGIVYLIMDDDRFNKYLEFSSF